MTAFPRWKETPALLIIGLSLGLAHCGPRPEKLIQKNNPAGFILAQPAGWEARTTDKGCILVKPVETEKDSSFLLIYPFILKKPESTSFWVGKNLGALENLFAQVSFEKTKSLRTIPDETAFKFSFTKNNIPCEGLALCSIYEKSGVLYVLASRREEFETRKAQLLAMARSFRFTMPDKTAPLEAAKPTIRYSSWQDPVEQAFSLDVPEGWQTQGGTFRRASVDIVHVLSAVSPDKKINIQFNDNNIPAFVIPNQMLAMAGFGQGSWYSPGYGVRMMVMPYMPGLVFLKNYLQRNYIPRLKGFEVIEEKDRPDIVQEFNRIQSQNQAYGISFQLHAGDSAFRFDEDGEPYIGYGLAVTQIVQSTGMPGGNWAVALVLVYTCRQDDAETVREAATHMFQSVRMNPQWVASQQQLTANVSQIVTQTNQAISGIINDAYWTRQGTLDNIHRKYSNAVLGVTDVVDPETGTTYKVEAGHNYYWIKGSSDQVAGTETFTRPDIDFSLLQEF